MTTSRWYLLGVLIAVCLGFSAARTQTPTALAGAWQSTASSGSTTVLTIENDYAFFTTFSPGSFGFSRGGVWKADAKKATLTVEFDSKDSTQVGKTETYNLTLRNDAMQLNGPAGAQAFKRLDTPTSGSTLAGLWRITGRANEAGQMNPMQRGARKTLKMLTATRFQWVALNPETKLFGGTGGGTYTLKDGQYTETIDFFSRDNSRVGKSLTFKADVQGNDWHHSGRSSAGAPIHEIWSREQ